jgi:hypothetical protein
MSTCSIMINFSPKETNSAWSPKQMRKFRFSERFLYGMDYEDVLLDSKLGEERSWCKDSMWHLISWCQKWMCKIGYVQHSSFRDNSNKAQFSHFSISKRGRLLKFTVKLHCASVITRTLSFPCTIGSMSSKLVEFRSRTSRDREGRRLTMLTQQFWNNYLKLLSLSRERWVKTCTF